MRLSPYFFSLVLFACSSKGPQNDNSLKVVPTITKQKKKTVKENIELNKEGLDSDRLHLLIEDSTLTVIKGQDLIYSSHFQQTKHIPPNITIEDKAYKAANCVLILRNMVYANEAGIPVTDSLQIITATGTQLSYYYKTESKIFPENSILNNFMQGTVYDNKTFALIPISIEGQLYGITYISNTGSIIEIPLAEHYLSSEYKLEFVNNKAIIEMWEHKTYTRKPSLIISAKGEFKFR